jgi:hypothetical protein
VSVGIEWKGGSNGGCFWAASGTLRRLNREVNEVNVLAAADSMEAGNWRVSFGRPRAGDVCFGSWRVLRLCCGVAGSDAPLKFMSKIFFYQILFFLNIFSYL